MFQQVLEARTRLLGEEHPDTLWVYRRLGDVAGGKGEFHRITVYQRHILGVLRRIAYRDDARLRQKRDYVQFLTWDAVPELQNPQEGLEIMLAVNEATDYSDRIYRDLLAECHFRVGEYEKAIEILEGTRPMFAEDQVWWHTNIDRKIAKYRAAMGGDDQRRQAAIDDIARKKLEAEAEGASPRARNRYAWDLIDSEYPDLHRPAEAIRIAEEVNAETGRQRPHMLNTLAVAYLLNGQKEKALATLDEAIALIPPDDNDLESYRWRREAFELYDQEQDFDILEVLPGKWLFTPPGAPMKVNIEWVREGEYVQCYVRDDIPGLPKGKALVRVHLETRKCENLRNDDPSWTITRWLPMAMRLTASGDLLFWDENWGAVRHIRP